MNQNDFLGKAVSHSDLGEGPVLKENCEQNLVSQYYEIMMFLIETQIKSQHFRYLNIDHPPSLPSTFVFGRVLPEYICQC